MNTHASPCAMSQKSVASMRAPRDVEYDAFSRAPPTLTAAQVSRDLPAKVAAAHQNNILLAGLSSPGNALPAGRHGEGAL